jgi:tetratricopeptide (TPR) repeat protein
LTRFTDAAKEFQKVIELAPEITQAYYYLGLCYNQINEFGQAIKMLETVIDRENDNVFGHYHLASNLFAAKRFERALYHYRRVLEIDPDFEDAAEVNMIIMGIEKLEF